MTAIKEYPFDLSDLQKSEEERSAQHQASILTDSAAKPRSSISSHTHPDVKRRVSIMADENSKDRENQPSDR